MGGGDEEWVVGIQRMGASEGKEVLLTKRTDGTGRLHGGMGLEHTEGRKIT